MQLALRASLSSSSLGNLFGRFKFHVWDLHSQIYTVGQLAYMNCKLKCNCLFGTSTWTHTGTSRLNMPKVEIAISPIRSLFPALLKLVMLCYLPQSAAQPWTESELWASSLNIFPSPHSILWQIQ